VENVGEIDPMASVYNFGRKREGRGIPHFEQTFKLIYKHG